MLVMVCQWLAEDWPGGAPWCCRLSERGMDEWLTLTIDQLVAQLSRLGDWPWALWSGVTGRLSVVSSLHWGSFHAGGRGQGQGQLRWEEQAGPSQNP